VKMASSLQKERTVGEVGHVCLGSKLLCLFLAPQTGDVLCNIQSLTDWVGVTVSGRRWVLSGVVGPESGTVGTVILHQFL
jgi:hypothetical protein